MTWSLREGNHFTIVRKSQCMISEPIKSKCQKRKRTLDVWQHCWRVSGSHSKTHLAKKTLTETDFREYFSCY